MPQQPQPEPRPPASWPSTAVTFASSLVYSSATTSELQTRLHTPSAATATWPKVSSEDVAVYPHNVAIQPVTDPRHPAHGQHRLCATRHLPPDSFILPYVGLVHTDSPADTDGASDYDLSLDRELGLSIDAAKLGNEARFVNDYRGIADKPNAEFRDCWVRMAKQRDARSLWERRIGIFVLSAGKAGKRRRGISPGQEILVNYGRSFWAERRDGDAKDGDEDGRRPGLQTVNTAS